jgi:hypothetical protein
MGYYKNNSIYIRIINSTKAFDNLVYFRVN